MRARVVGIGGRRGIRRAVMCLFGTGASVGRGIGGGHCW